MFRPGWRMTSVRSRRRPWRRLVMLKLGPSFCPNGCCRGFPVIGDRLCQLPGRGQSQYVRLAKFSERKISNLLQMFHLYLENVTDIYDMFSRQITQGPAHDTSAICFRQGATIRATCCGGFETFGCFGFAHLSSREPGKPLNGFAGLCDLFFSCKHRAFYMAMWDCYSFAYDYFVVFF